jgi:clan AA aspartic protease (TIGR02281 family)
MLTPKTILMAGMVALAASSANASIRLQCDAPVIATGEGPGANPVVSISVSQEGHVGGGWQIIYRLADGKVISRNEQYHLADYSDASSTKWKGQLRKNPNLWMVGEIFRDGSGYRYREFIRDAVKGGQVTMDMSARCIDENVVAQSDFPRGVDQAPPTGGSEIVRMVGDGGTFKVPVTINGQLTLDFIVDSGASDVSIPADVVLTLWRTGTITEADFIGARTYTMADGSTVPSQRFLIRSLKVGDKVLANVTASIAPVTGGLLLGQSFLTRFKSWSIDNQRQALVLN